MKSILLSLSLISIFVSFSQVEDSLSKKDSIKPKYWKLKAIYGLNGTQSSFVNWNAGGRNNISLLGTVLASANYSKGNVKWTNDFSFALGGMQFIEKGTSETLQKTDDRIDIASNFGMKIKKHVFVSFIGGFKTQFLDGFSYPNDSIRISTFMAPGYVSAALGIDYIKSDNFSVFTSPFASKMTFVNDQLLANSGAFGVEKATFDGLGNVLTAGKRFRGEFGAYLKIKFNKTVAKNIDLKSKFELFSNYVNNPQNVDVNAEALFTFKVNSWFSASLQWSVIYDDDINIRDANDQVGPRTQFKSVLGIGISYKMKNFKE